MEMTSNPQSSGQQPLGPTVGSGPPQGFGPPIHMQFRPILPPQQSHPFMPAASHQFLPVGQGMTGSNAGIHSPLFPQPSTHLPSIPGPSGQGPPSSQAIPMPFIQSNRPGTSGTLQPMQNTAVPNNHFPNLNGGGMPLSSSYTFATSYGQAPNSNNASSQYQQSSQMHTSTAPVGGQPWSTSETQSAQFGASSIQSAQQTSAPVLIGQPGSSEVASDWQEHTSPDGRKYYYNKKTRLSSWEKPIELLTPTERADASTDWKEFTSAEGRKYYYNKVTKQSKWTIPDDLKLARELAKKAGTQPSVTETAVASIVPAPSVVEPPVHPAITSTQAPVSVPMVASGSLAVTSIPGTTVASGSPSVVTVPPAVVTTTSFSGTSEVVGEPVLNLNTPTPVPPVSLSTELPSGAADSTDAINAENSSLSNVSTEINGASAQDLEEAKRGMPVAGKVNVTPLEEKRVDEEPLVFSNKLEAKNAFKSLLESSIIESDWSWEQAMRVIINDKRYGALKTLGERKQAFNEYLGQKKKQEAEEKRIKQKKTRDDFTKMLEECKELTSTTRWSKAVNIFESDERFTAVERPRDREDLFETYLSELQKKEKAKAAEEHKRRVAEYRAFLESCDFVKVNSQWRKVQDRLEDDERCSRLDKVDRLEIFQEYINDLEKEEELQRKIQKENLRKEERKNRDAFRKLLEDDVATGLVTAKTHWRDYCMKVTDSPAYLAVSSNTSGATAKNLFEDVVEELQKQYHDDRAQIKEAVKIGKITLTSTLTLESFKDSVRDDDNMKKMSEINLELIFDELIERLREKEEKEAKKLQRFADVFATMLQSMKEITALSRWEECKMLFADSQEYRSIIEESFARQIFEEYVAHLQEKAKEKERKREEEKAKKEKEREEKERRKEKARKEKEREREKEKEREREKEKGRERSKKGEKKDEMESESIKEKGRERSKKDEKKDEMESESIKEKGRERSKKDDKKDEMESESIDVTDNHGGKERKREKDKDRKHRRRHHSSVDDGSSEKDEKEELKKSRKHSSDRKKSRKHGHATDSDSENRHKRHRKDRDGSRRSVYDELEDGELGEDEEIH